MIRINLLPQQGGRRPVRAAAPVSSGGGQGWLVAYLVISVLFCAGLAVVYSIYTDRLEEQRNKNAALERRITEEREKSARLDEKKALLARSLELEKVVDELNRGRVGPTRMLLELAKILSVGGAPTIDPDELEQLRRENPLAGYNASWDPKRLWITSFSEDGKRCTIKGIGKTNEDVAEFLQRLNLSELFENVTLQKTEATKVGKSLEVIAFEISCTVKY